MRQEIDGLTEQVRIMNENQEIRHQDLMNKLEQLADAVEDRSRQEVSQEDIEEIKVAVDSTQSEISDLVETVKSIDEHLVKEETER